jgi:monoterpene epsilon-lactone hydrolase
MTWILIAVLVVILGMVIFFYLHDENHSQYDGPLLSAPAVDAGEEHYEVLDLLAMLPKMLEGKWGKSRILAIREYLDAMSDGQDYASEFIPHDDGSVRGEWVIAPEADPKRRLLYIHGGAFFAGSPKSHRSFTDQLSQLARAAVFAVDYRLMPEHKFAQGMEDVRTAYRWILDNGPSGKSPLDFLVVAGDSAGGLHTLSVIAWARDEGLRPADRAIAYSPPTDNTLSSPSLRTNLKTDPLLGPQFSWLLYVPRPLIFWLLWAVLKIRPSDPSVSPLRGDLSGLPPTLIQVSEAELLLDDARRYVNKANASGSTAVLQSWPHMVHVWKAFLDILPQAREAYDLAKEFIDNPPPAPETVQKV